MDVKIEIDPGICKFHTTVAVTADKKRNVSFDFTTACETIQQFAEQIKAKSPISVLKELNPKQESVVLEIGRSLLAAKGCCEACTVPIGVCKAMYVATGMALPADVHFKLTPNS